MSDDGKKGGQDGGGQQRGGGSTEFLDLELSKVMYGEADGLTRQAYRELLLDAAKAHMKARIGDKIEALAKVAVDELIDDIDANLEIERLIEARNAKQKKLEARLREVFQGPQEGDGDGDDAKGDAGGD